MADKAHAILSASSSDRWLHCPPSARLCETYEDKGSDYAAEGTDAHALGEYKLKTALGMPADDPTDSLKWYSEEMEDATSGYAEYVLEQVEAAKETCADPVVLIEQRVDFSRWTKLMTQGIIDPILFNKETNELLSQADSFRDEINALKNAVSGDVTKVTAATALLHFTEKGGILQDFDDDLFEEYVNRIIVRSRNEVCFELKCGLTLRERM